MYPHYYGIIFPFIQHCDIALLTVGRMTGLDFFIYVCVGKSKKKSQFKTVDVYMNWMDILYSMWSYGIRCLYRYVWLRGGTFIIYIYSLIFFQLLKIYLNDELWMVIIHLLNVILKEKSNFEAIRGPPENNNAWNSKFISEFASCITKQNPTDKIFNLFCVR